MSNALILIDIQNDYFPGGNMELVGIQDAAEKAKHLLQAYRDKGLPYFHIQHLSAQPGATFFVPETPGVEIHETVRPQSSDKVIQKNFPNSFRKTELLDELQTAGIESLTICGAMSHMCVDATTRAAFDFGFKCIVAADACATKDLQYQDKTIAANEVHGAFMAALFPVYAQLKQTDAVIASL